MTDSELKSLVKMGESEELTEETRKRYDGSYITLSSGVTHYEIKGEGEPVVLVHGYSTPYFIYEKVFARLVELGYKVIRYDLYGRGFSDRVPGKHTPAFFAKQLDELTKALLGDEKFILVGTSMGGAVTSAYCLHYPGKVKKLILMAPAGMDSFKPPLYMKLCALPVLGNIIFELLGDSIFIKGSQKELHYVSQEEKDWYTRCFAEGCRYKGFLKCTLSSLRNTILNTGETIKGYQAVNSQKIPVLAIWGTIDGTMPYYQHERLLETIPDAKFVTFENSGHLFLFDEAEKTMKEIEEFIQ